MLIRIVLFVAVLTLLLTPWPAGAQGLAPLIMDREPGLLDGEMATFFGELGLLTDRAPITGFAFGPGRKELAFCAPASDGRVALWTMPVGVWQDSTVSGKPSSPPYHTSISRPRLLWSAPEGTTLRGPIWWSPDGAQLAVRVFRGDHGQSLLAVDYGSGKAQELAAGADVQEMAWSQDAKRLAYIERAPEGMRVCLQTFPPAQARRLAPGDRDLRWSLSLSRRTLRWFAHSDTGWAQMVWDPEDDKITEERRLPARSEGAICSPDGRMVAVVEGDPKRLVVSSATDPKGEVLDFRGIHPQRVLGWSPDSHLVLLLADRNLPVAVSVTTLRDDILKALEKQEKLVFADVRASVAGPPVNLDAGPPNWSSNGSLLANVWSSDRPADFLHWLHPERKDDEPAPDVKQALIVLEVKRERIPEETVQRAEGDAEKAIVLSNAKQISLALQMYMTDFTALPSDTSIEALRQALDSYLKNSKVWLRPGGDEVVVQYLLPPGLRDRDIQDPAHLPMVLIDILPKWDIVGFADGHVRAYPKGSDWGQNNLPQQ